MDKRTETMIVFCTRCNAPGKVLYDRVSNKIMKSHFSCKCTKTSEESTEMGS